MENFIYHEFLVNGDTLETCQNKTAHFLKTNKLAMPLQFDFLEKRTIRADEKGFKERINLGAQENKIVLNGFISELKKEGFYDINHVSDIPQGYLSKIFHTIAHLLDGFFGIDAYFYNLVEDSYFISYALFEKINNEPNFYYIISVEATYKMKKGLSFEK
jgi:hypothetical protein